MLRENPKKFWKHVHYNSNKYKASVPLPDPNDFANYFSTTLQNNFVSSKFPNISPMIDGLLDNIITSEDEIDELLENTQLKTKTSPDGLHGSFLFHTRKANKKLFSHLFNLCFINGYYPSQWKVSNIFPLLKSGDPSLPANYRPISLQSLLGKLFEKIIYKRIYNHVKNFISPSQHYCFISRSTNTNLLATVGSILNEWENSRDVAIFYADLSKAFDSVNHNLLFYKLENQYGICGNLLKTLRFSLQNRTFKVIINAKTSNSFPINSGVPQGGVLSPLLFTLFVNDLDQKLSSNCKVLQYADDVKIITSGYTQQEAVTYLHEEASNLSRWCSDWGLTLNPKKSKICIFSWKRQTLPNDFQFRFQGDSIPIVNSVNDLGITLDKKLTFHNYVTRLNLRLRSILAFFWRNFKSIRNTSAIRAIYFAFAQSLFDYGLPVWGTASDTAVKPLIATHKKFMKFISNIPTFNHQYSYEELSQMSKIPTLNNRYLYLCSSLAFNHLRVGNFDHILDLKLAVPLKRTRNTLLFNVPFMNLDISKRFFWVKMPHLFNTLPLSIDPFYLNKGNFLSSLKTFLGANTYNT